MFLEVAQLDFSTTGWTIEVNADVCKAPRGGIILPQQATRVAPCSKPPRGRRRMAAGEVDWLAFERAVAAFLQALDPKSVVRHDVRTPDLDTGRLRQRDVWIDTSFGGHLRITLLVSCKHKKTKLSQQDIDAFVGELRAAGANKGVLYAYGGFTAPALEKARKLGISCCSLYVDRPPDLPQVLTFEAYCLREQFRLETRGTTEPVWHFLPELFDRPLIDEGQTRPTLAVLVGRYNRARESAMAGISLGDRPTWWAEVDILEDEEEKEESGPGLRLRIHSSWAVYQARFESWLLNGSYSFTEQTFAGSLSTPWIDRMSAHPGPGWQRIEPNAIRPSGNFMTIYSHGGDLEAEVREHFSGPQPAALDQAARH